jgi:hypothetical protein
MNQRSFELVSTATEVTPSLTSTNPVAWRTEVYEQQLQHYDPIAHFRKVTSLENPSLPFVITPPLLDHITPEQFSAFCSAFADGMEYVRQKFGTQPAAIMLEDDKQQRIYCDSETLTVHVSRFLIDHLIQRGPARDGKTEPLILDPFQVAFVAGIEESFHAHQARTDPEKHHRLQQEAQKTGIKPGDRNYNDLPIESEARDVVRQAMIDTGIVYTAPIAVSNVNPEDMEWAKEFIKLRATPSPAIPTTHIDMAQLQQRINEAQEKKTVTLVIR